MFGPAGFGSPHVYGTPPRVHMEPRAADEPFVFMVLDDTVRFQSKYECIQGCDDSAGSQPTKVFIGPEEVIDGPRGLRR